MSAGRSFRRRSNGKRVLLIEPEIVDDLPAAAKNALVARRQANRDGRCPTCSAEMVVTRDRSGIFHGTFEHSDDCPVPDPLDAA